jgi:CO dehydrogenase/acetyl-CoA synthase alpha subunit
MIDRCTSKARTVFLDILVQGLDCQIWMAASHLLNAVEKEVGGDGDVAL